MNTKTIWKYPIEIRDSQIVKMPKGSKILSAQFQLDVLCLWAMVDAAEQEKEDRHIHIFGTGQWLTEPAVFRLIATAQRCPMVWHVFECFVKQYEIK